MRLCSNVYSCAKYRLSCYVFSTVFATGFHLTSDFNVCATVERLRLNHLLFTEIIIETVGSLLVESWPTVKLFVLILFILLRVMVMLPITLVIEMTCLLLYKF